MPPIDGNLVERLAGEPDNVAEQLEVMAALSGPARSYHRFDEYLLAAANIIRTPSLPPMVSEAMIEAFKAELDRQNVPYAPLTDGPPNDVCIYNSGVIDLDGLARTALRVRQDALGSEDVVEALVALADGADKCAEAPHFIVQPFLAIYKKHGETIAKARAIAAISKGDSHAKG